MPLLCRAVMSFGLILLNSSCEAPVRQAQLVQQVQMFLKQAGQQDRPHPKQVDQFE